MATTKQETKPMQAHPWDEVERRYRTADEIADNKRWARLELDGATLAELRALLGLSQAAMGERVGVHQVEVGRAEKRADLQLSTLRRYVDALGGRLELVARFGERAVTLRFPGPADFNHAVLAVDGEYPSTAAHGKKKPAGGDAAAPRRAPRGKAARP